MSRFTFSPAEHFARAGYDALAGQVTYFPSDWLSDDERRAWYDARVIKLLRGASRPKKEPRGDNETPVSFCGQWIDWHIYLPELKVWAGQATMGTILFQRLVAIWDRDPDASLLEWQLPLITASGLDPRSVVRAIDAGFSVADLGMPVLSFAASELLAIIGMQITPLTRLGRRHYAYQFDGRTFDFRVVEREGYHRMLSESRLVDAEKSVGGNA